MQGFGWGSVDLVFPPRCPACARRRARPSLCHICLANIPRVHSPLCPTCGVPFHGCGPDHECSGCLTKRRYFNRARACAVYGGIIGADNPLALALHRYKYGCDVTLAPTLGKFLADYCPLTVDHDLLVPVPLHINRLRWRGFNQALLLAKPLAKHCSAQLHPFVLCRTRATQPQVGLGEAERRSNIAGAFAVRDAALVRNRSVLLLDDVYTTGATVNECARTLRRAGARQVDVLVLARAEAGCV